MSVQMKQTELDGFLLHSWSQIKIVSQDRYVSSLTQQRQITRKDVKDLVIRSTLFSPVKGRSWKKITFDIWLGIDPKQFIFAFRRQMQYAEKHQES